MEKYNAAHNKQNPTVPNGTPPPSKKQPTTQKQQPGESPKPPHLRDYKEEEKNTHTINKQSQTTHKNS